MGLEKIVLGFFLGILLLDGLLLCTAYNVHHYSFILKETNFTRLCSTKNMLVVNGQFPGPTIHIRKGDRAFVNVHNNGNYGVTIHWHGVKQPNNAWSDGPENITQCPIQSGKNFTYEVIFSTEEGTLWWHAHSDWSRATVHGAIVVLPAINGTTYPFPKPYAQEVIILGEWYKGDVKFLIDNATAYGSEPTTSDAYTINGEPGYPNNCSNETTYRLQVDYGKTYLLRIVCAVMNEEMFFAIANHTLTVVAQDGAYIKPINTSYIMITPGQTMDILLTANQSPSYYYMAASPFVDAVVPYDSSNTSAILQYRGSYTPPSSPPYPSLPDIDDMDAADNFTTRIRALASPDHMINVPLNITKQIFITVSINVIPCWANKTCYGKNGSRQAASLNNISFVTPKIDILQAYYSGLMNVFENDFPDRPFYIFNYTGEYNDTEVPNEGTKVHMINYGEQVEIVFQGTNIGNVSENHPMHLHGFSFYLVGTGYGNFNKITSPKTYNLIDPPEVNTIGVVKNGWAAIRFLADNPGVWFMHCHLERHASWGMNTVLIVKNGPTNETSIQEPPPNMPTCS